MSACEEVLLMTATVNVGSTCKVNISGRQERLQQYICSLLSWINYSDIQRIVFCENTGTDYDFNQIVQYAKSRGKLLEALVFNGNDGASIYGKGFGEGKILEYALQNSAVLQDESTSFYKITGRNYVSNFNVVCDAHKNSDMVFQIPGWTTGKDTENTAADELNSSCFNLKDELAFFSRTKVSKEFHNPDNNVSTVFYKTNVKSFREVLQDSYLRVHDGMGFYIEHAYYYALLGNKINHFRVDPVIVGKSGTHGTLYGGADYTEVVKSRAQDFME